MVISGFSNIIGYGMSLLGGKHGLAAWRWVSSSRFPNARRTRADLLARQIFLLFGVITIGLGIIAFFCIVDFPDKNTFLTPEQTQFMVQRIQADRGDAEPDSLTARKFLAHAADFKIWVSFVVTCSNGDAR